MTASLHLTVRQLHEFSDTPPNHIIVATYVKNSVAVLRVDSNFTVVESALKGYIKWRAGHGAKPQQDVRF